MCLIGVALKRKPTEEEIVNGFTSNPHGVGVAWLGSGAKVNWEKGLSSPVQVIKLIKEKPLPLVVHFRLASMGDISPELCHPFPIEPEVRLSLKGSTNGSVLFHNGHWESCLTTAITISKVLGKPIPSGKLTDSRLMAWIAALGGIEALKPLKEKIAVLSPTGPKILSQKLWVADNGVVWSNNSFKPLQKWDFNLWKKRFLDD